MTHVTVAGGTYIERCSEPHWDEILGSGLRGALVLRQLGASVRYVTFADAPHASSVVAMAQDAGIPAEIADTATMISFTYRHALARPFIDPPLHRITGQSPLRVTDENVLRYGMLEGDAVVHADYAVYDPQNSERPTRFGKNGSTAKHLAIIANAREARLLSGQEDARLAGEALLAEEGAEVVVLKRGARGCVVLSASGAVEVPAYHTERVFPIGSGDVFSAAFMWAWSVQHLAPGEAADFASRATATYCNVPEALLTGAFKVSPLALRPIRPVAGADSRQVYLAGPFFTTGQRWVIEEALQSLRNQHVRVFSPFHEIGIGPAETVAREDIKGLEASSAVLAIIDGRDAGTLFELGWARARSIPVVAFVQNEPEEPLKMLVGTGCEVTGDFVSAVYRAAWAAIES